MYLIRSCRRRSFWPSDWIPSRQDSSYRSRPSWATNSRAMTGGDDVVDAADRLACPAMRIPLRAVRSGLRNEAGGLFQMSSCGRGLDMQVVVSPASWMWAVMVMAVSMVGPPGSGEDGVRRGGVERGSSGERRWCFSVSVEEVLQPLSECCRPLRRRGVGVRCPLARQALCRRAGGMLEAGPAAVILGVRLRHPPLLVLFAVPNSSGYLGVSSHSSLEVIP